MIFYIIIIIGIIFLVCIISWITDTHRFVVRRYDIVSDKVKRDVCFVMISDLHNKDYGNDNQKIIDTVNEIKPEAVLIAGDMPDALKGHDFSPAINLIRNLAKRYPIYYGYGNHEYRMKLYPEDYGTMWEDFSSELDRIGVHIMDNESAYLEDTGIEIDALTIERRFYKRIKGGILSSEDVKGYLGDIDDPNEPPFRLLIAHNPEYFEAYSKWGADLTVSGHVHGGIMRLPYLGGVISPRFRLFPKYSGGEYELNGRKMIVSCGLGTHTIHVRVFNPGELSVINIKKS
ncbi:MAG: metallophosphoesterase [Lachnospiraceae bacterium]|nr:metallophosphoesterase [Lachnospiraceae bacterium]